MVREISPTLMDLNFIQSIYALCVKHFEIIPASAALSFSCLYDAQVDGVVGIVVSLNLSAELKN